MTPPITPGAISTDTLDHLAFEYTQALAHGALSEDAQKYAAQIFAYKIELAENTIRALQATIKSLYDSATTA